MSKLIEMLLADEELNSMKKEWRSLTEKQFPPFNFDQYYDTDEYKERCKEKLNRLKESCN